MDLRCGDEGGDEAPQLQEAFSVADTRHGRKRIDSRRDTRVESTHERVQVVGVSDNLTISRI